MHKYSKDTDINNLVKRLLKQGWKIRAKSRKHTVLIAPNSRRIAVPSTPSDYRAFYNFEASINKLIMM